MCRDGYAWVSGTESKVHKTQGDIENGRFRVLAILHAEEERRLLAGGAVGDEVDLHVLEGQSDVAALLRRESFELLLLDADLSHDELHETIQRVRAVTLDLPIIFLSDQPSNEVLLYSMESGTLDVLRKPLDAALLRRLAVTQRDRLRGSPRTNVEAFVARKHVAYEIPSDVNLLPLVANKVAADIHATGAIDSGQMYSLNLAIFESLTNSLEHGNLEIGFDRKTEMVRAGEYLARLRELCRDSPFRNRRIFVEYEVAPDRVDVWISDEGPGFDFSSFQRQEGPGEEAFHGRGLLLAMKMVDQVTYDSQKNQLRLTINRV